MSSWYSTMTQLGLPNPTLLVGPYSPKTLAPLSSNSFSSSEPLTARLRHADVVLYSLLGFISPTTRATLPSWPPMTLPKAKALRAELSKGVEQVLKAEKDSWDEQITWRRSWLDEAKGERWERCLSALGAVALRRALESKQLVGQLPDLGSLSSLSTAEAITESLARIVSLYESEATNTSQLLYDRRVELLHLRQEKHDLLATRAHLETRENIFTEHDNLTLSQLIALVNEQAAGLENGVWGLLLTGEPTSDHPSVKEGSTKMPQRLAPRPPPSPLDHPSSSALTSHLNLLGSLSTLCDPLSLPPLSNLLPSASADLTSADPPATSQHPSAYSSAFLLDTSRLSSFPAHTAPQPTPLLATQPLMAVSAETAELNPLARLLRPSRSTPDEDDGMELRISQVLDSLEPKVQQPKAKARVTGWEGKSRLPLAKSVMGRG